MIKEALELLFAKAAASLRPKVIKPKQEPDHVYLLALPDGQVKRTEAAPHPRCHVVNDIPSLIDALKLAPGMHTIWFNRRDIIGVFDDRTRRDGVRIDVGLSPQIDTLLSWKKESPPFDQKKAVFTFRTHFFGCGADTFVAIIRNLKFNLGGESEQAHGKRSLSVNMIAQASGVDKLPEELTLDLPIFANPQVQVRRKIRLAVEVDPSSPSNPMFTFIPYPLQIEEAITSAEQELGGRVRDVLEKMESESAKSEDGGDRWQVLYGKP